MSNVLSTTINPVVTAGIAAGAAVVARVATAFGRVINWPQALVIGSIPAVINRIAHNVIPEGWRKVVEYPLTAVVAFGAVKWLPSALGITGLFDPLTVSENAAAALIAAGVTGAAWVVNNLPADIKNIFRIT